MVRNGKARGAAGSTGLAGRCGRGCLALALALFAAAGCAGRPFSHLEYSYRVTDDPEAGLIAIAPGVGDYLTGAASRDDMRDLYRNAARRFLAESGRVCTITDAEPSGRTGWRFRYEC